MYVILTSKPGQFRTEPGDGIAPVEVYEYRFCGRIKAEFVIGRLDGETRVRVVEESNPSLVNRIPSKFLPRFETLERARSELQQLARFGTSGDMEVVRR